MFVFLSSCIFGLRPTLLAVGDMKEASRVKIVIATCCTGKDRTGILEVMKCFN